MPPRDRARAARAIDEFLRALGHEPAGHPDLGETGARVADAWCGELLDGEDVDVVALLRAESFVEPTPAHGPGVVALRDLEVSTVCPHHLLPAIGSALVAYVPGERVTGFGTITRVLDSLAHRLTLQERISQDVVSALMDGLGARGAACVLRLQHGCLAARGPRSHGRIETVATAGSLAPGGDLHGLVAGWLGRGKWS